MAPHGSTSRQSYAGDWSRLRRTFGAQRRLIASLLAATAVVLAVSAARPRPAPTTPVWVAAHDLGGGGPLRADDMRVVRLPAADVPTGALPIGHSLAGRFLAAPVRAGEPLTDVRLLSPALLAADGSSGQLAVSVRISDAGAALALVQAGDRVDVLAGTDPASGEATPRGPVVQDVRVLAVPSHLPPDGTGLIIVAATPPQAAAVAAVPAGDPLSLALRRG
jgi:Flp pilus assembly protein CpaB